MSQIAPLVVSSSVMKYMNQKDVQIGIEQAFLFKSEELKKRVFDKARIRALVMEDVRAMAMNNKEQRIAELLSHSRVSIDTKIQMRIKSSLMSEVQNSLRSREYGFERGLIVVMRKSFSLLFAVVILITLAFGPLQVMNNVQFVQTARASYISCNGAVRINNELCSKGSKREVGSGDLIETLGGASATIVYSNFARTQFSENTSATLGIDKNLHNPVRLFLSKGRLWHYSPAETSFVRTNVVNAEISGGAVVVETPSGKRGTTEVYATVPYKVQIVDRNNNATKLTLLNSEKISISNRSRNFRKSQLSQTDSVRSEWVANNSRNDRQYMNDLKESVADSKQSAAGRLPGSFQDSVGKFAQRTKIILTREPKAKSELRLGLLEELFSEALTLAEKGDKATALSTFQSYREKFTSLIHKNFASVSKEKTGIKNKELALFKEHQEIVSLYKLEDDQYYLRELFTEMAVDIEPYIVGKSSDDVVREIASAELIEAHKKVQSGDIALAKRHLESYESILDIPRTEHVSKDNAGNVPSKYGNTDDLVILQDIAEKSESLSPLVKRLSTAQVDNINDQASDKLPQTVTTGSVVGTAYREPETDRSTTKIVGLAVKNEEDEISL